MADRILIVDDNDLNRAVLADFVEAMGFQTICVDNGLDAMDIMRREPADMVLLDVMMPRMGGEQVLRQLKNDERTRDVPVVMVSALDDVDRVARCIEAGADDYLVKPFNHSLLKARIRACMETKLLRDRERAYRRRVEEQNQSLEERVRDQIEEISHAQLATIFAMSKLAESRDDETGEHLDRMREYCLLLAQTLAQHQELGYADQVGERFILNLYAASPLHDIGKVGIPDRILLKPDKLTEEEFDLMRLHPGIGADTLRAVEDLHTGNGFVRTGIEIAECHHERWDGSGYPHGLSNSDIPLVGRIVALADVYDALTTKRCYKDAIPHEESRKIILDGSGRHFDPAIVEAFTLIEDKWREIHGRLRDGEKTASRATPRT